MTTPRLWKRWRVTRALLENARSMLPEHAIENDGGNRELEIATLESYNDYLDHNELELALDQLETLGELNDVRGGFWRTLAKAATMMGLDERFDQYETAFEAALDRHLPDGDVATEQSREPERRNQAD